MQFGKLTHEEKLAMFSFWLHNKGSKTKYIARAAKLNKGYVWIRDRYPSWSDKERYKIVENEEIYFVQI